jgi:hypothetical protein
MIFSYQPGEAGHVLITSRSPGWEHSEAGWRAAVRAALADAGEHPKGRTEQPHNQHPKVIRQAPIGRPAGDSENSFAAFPDARHEGASTDVDGTPGQSIFLASVTPVPENTTPGSVWRNVIWLPEGKLYMSLCTTVPVISVPM